MLAPLAGGFVPSSSQAKNCAGLWVALFGFWLPGSYYTFYIAVPFMNSFMYFLINYYVFLQCVETSKQPSRRLSQSYVLYFLQCVETPKNSHLDVSNNYTCSILVLFLFTYCWKPYFAISLCRDRHFWHLDKTNLLMHIKLISLLLFKFLLWFTRLCNPIQNILD